MDTTTSPRHRAEARAPYFSLGQLRDRMSRAHTPPPVHQLWSYEHGQRFQVVVGKRRRSLLIGRSEAGAAVAWLLTAFAMVAPVLVGVAWFMGQVWQAGFVR